MKNPTLDVAIISRFRPKFLEKCLDSLKKQDFKPQKIILVISPSDKNSQKLVKKFKLPIVLKFQEEPGYAFPRNKALLASKADFLYFLDDDCLLAKNSLKEAYNFLNNHQKYLAVLGKSININNGFYSQFAQWSNEAWLDRLWDKKEKTFKSLDTKNVCFRRKAIINFRFFECLGSEDVDFGFQISSHGGKIAFNSKMIAYHDEQAMNFLKYVKKRIRMVKGLAIVKRRWGNLPYFYNNDQKYERKIRTSFQKSKYNEQLKYRLFLESAFFLRKIRRTIDKVIF